ncbi:protein FAM234A-like [Salmo trutta]|uniref:protein FAM234A-like n=1 Tax=Salmo trutta TaxID=8032 RepID=UPI001132239C|nr:protein FAM234A-like [Salmo trutta]XP_029619924.1 protein FAM234A-like [Salmo trutta]XP_029619925.1 protein FAM234A-like [Salmo trutta]
MDVLFVLKDSKSSQNISCFDAGLDTRCVFVSEVAGTNGETLWERPLAPEFHWAHCGLDGLREMDRGCLLSHSNQLTAIDKYTGMVTWLWPQPPNLSSTLPVLCPRPGWGRVQRRGSGGPQPNADTVGDPLKKDGCPDWLRGGSGHS